MSHIDPLCSKAIYLQTLAVYALVNSKEGELCVFSQSKFSQRHLFGQSRKQEIGAFSDLIRNALFLDLRKTWHQSNSLTTFFLKKAFQNIFSKGKTSVFKKFKFQIVPKKEKQQQHKPQESPL